MYIIIRFFIIIGGMYNKKYLAHKKGPLIQRALKKSF
ncbi:MAG: hypothetical protein JWR38_429 [Mucilaginibacter sp.]|nr:hypothetical protein [Mucilaginibacter sp.]